MNIIVAIAGIIGVIASLALPVGLVMLCLKKWHKRGIRLSLASLGIVIAASVMGALMNPEPAKREPTQLTTQIEKPTQPPTPNPAPTKEDVRKAKLVAKTKRMTDGIIAAVRQHYKIEPQPLFPGSPLCRDDGYCDFEANSIRIQVYGAGLAVVETTDQVSRTDYLEMCSVVFAGISGANVKFAGESVGLAYGRALNAGSADQDVTGVQIKIAPDLGNRLGCRFFKYGN